MRVSFFAKRRGKIMGNQGERCRCSSVNMSYGRKRILSSCSLALAAGEIVGLAGENGTGKTTLLKGLLGFLPIDSGSVQIAAPVGFCPQENILNRSLTVAEHFRFVDAICRRLFSPDLASGEELLRGTGLSNYLKTPIGNLSGGTYQKVKLITAVWGRPSLLVLDEPCDGFDWQMYLLFWQLLENLVGEGTGVLMVSHLIHDRERFRRIYTLSDGTLEQTQ
jgi:ABC-2 type transport system ATP-binding protein